MRMVSTMRYLVEVVRRRLHLDVGGQRGAEGVRVRHGHGHEAEHSPALVGPRELPAEPGAVVAPDQVELPPPQRRQR